ncbi:MAG: hypothetical protein KAV87_28735, partial [Desulfobacteraceae bacterium]|nr:hypothetical protein [Desulfobacteraceae bacterium]
MGLRVPDIPDDYGFGDDCLPCHDAGETPNYVFVRFYGIQSCPGRFPPPNGYLFTCKQTVGDPCIWHGEIEISTGKWSCNYDADFPWGLERRSEVVLSHVDPFEVAVFTSRSAGCSALHVNLQTNCTMGAGFNGSAVITIYIDPIIIFLT